MIRIQYSPFLEQESLQVSFKPNEFSFPLYLPYYQLFVMAFDSNSLSFPQIDIKEASKILLSGYLLVSKTLCKLRQDLLDTLKENKPLEERIRNFAERFNKSKGLDFSQYNIDPKNAKLFTPLETFAISNRLYLESAERSREELTKIIGEYEKFVENIELYIESKMNTETKIYGLLSCYF